MDRSYSFVNSTDATKSLGNEIHHGPGLLLTNITTALLSLVILVTLVGNLATIVAFVKVRSLHEKPSDLLILALSCADFGLGIDIILHFPVSAVGYWPWGEIGCQIYVLLGNTCVFSGVIITAFISLDRYLLISREYPMYIKLLTKRRIIISICLIYGYSSIMGIIEVTLWNYVPVPGGGKKNFDYSRECRSPPKHNFIYAMVMLMVNMFVPMIVVECLSFLFVVRLRSKLKSRARVGNQALSQSQSRGEITMASDSTNRPPRMGDTQNNASRNRYTKAAITLGALVITLNICMPPYVLYVIIVSFFCPECSNGSVREMLIYLIFVNSSINPLLYAATMGKIRRFYKSVFCK